MKIEKTSEGEFASVPRSRIASPSLPNPDELEDSLFQATHVRACQKVPEGFSRATCEEYDKACDAGNVKSLTDLKIYTPRLVENECIVDPESRLAQRFQSYMTDLTKLLLQKSSWQPPSEVLFLISCSEEPNACVFSKSVPPAIIFTTGILRELRNLDELAYLLGHELGHVKSKTSGFSKRRSKGDEIAADLYQVQWLHQAGLNPLAGANLMARFWRDEQKDGEQEARLQAFVVALCDEHLNSALRPNAIQNSVQGYARMHGIEAGFMNTPYTPVDPLIAEIFNHATPYDHVAGVAESFGFQDCTGEEQLTFILSQIEELGPGFAPHSRPTGIKELLEQCECDPHDSRHREIAMKCLSAMLAKPEVFNTCYGTLVENALNEEEFVPVGELEGIAAAIEQTVDATSKEELKNASHMMMQYVDRLRGLNFRALSFSCFELPKSAEVNSLMMNCTIPLPWNRHVQWAEELASEGETSALRALFRLGVEDKRLIQAMDVETLAEVMRGYNSELYTHDFSKSGTNPLIISGIPGRNKLGTLRIDFDAGVILGPIDSAFMEKYAWRPALFAQDQFQRAMRKRARQEIATLHSRSLQRAKSITSKSAFESWIADNIQALHIPSPFGLVKDLRHTNISLFVAKGEEEEFNEVTPNEIFDALRPLHSSFIESIVQALRERPEELRKIVRSFFLDEGSFSIFHVMSAAPSVYHENCLQGLYEANLSLYGHMFPSDYPEVEFVLRDPCGLFTLEEKIKILLETTSFPEDSDWYIRNFCTAACGSEAEQAIANIRALEEVYKLTSENPVTKVGIFNAIEKYLPSLLSDGGNISEILVKLDSIAPEITKGILLVEQRTWPQNPICQKFSEELTSLLNDSSQWPEDIEALAVLYRLAENGKYLHAHQIYRGLSERIVSKFNTETSALKKLHASERFLLNGVTINPILKAKAISAWKDAQCALLFEARVGNAGLDDGSEEYFEAAFNAAKSLKGRAPGTLIYELLSQLAYKVESQEKLSYALESLTPLGGINLDESDPQLRALEGLTLLLSSSRHRRFQFIDFLSEPLTPTTQDEFMNQVRSLLNDGLLFADYMGNFSWSIDPRCEIDGKNDSFEYWRIKSEQCYETFWQLPLAGRAAIIDQLLLPAEKRFHHDLSMEDSEFEESLKNDYAGQHKIVLENSYRKNAFSYVAGRCFPANMKYSSEACNFLELYSAVISPLQKNLLLAILLSVERRSADYADGEFGVGKRLAMILDMMGPAERKFGQGINSHPSSPADLRYDARELKFNASPLTRWDAWHEINRTVSSEYRPSIVRLGPALGSASYYVTYKIERSDGSKGALRMLRYGAFPQGKEGFRLLREFIDLYRIRYPESTEICEILDDLISQARSMSYVETNATIGLAQMLYGKRLYDGYRITVDSHTFSFSNAGWRAFGREFMDQEYQEGIHFIELPEGSGPLDAADEPSGNPNPERRYKRAAAKAYITMEFINVLSGNAFDHDRHGAQLRLSRIGSNETKMGLFDNGAIHAAVRKADGSLAQPYLEGRETIDDYDAVLAAKGHVEIPPPTSEEKLLLVRTLVKSIDDYLDPEVRRPIADSLYDEIKRIRAETGTTPEYLLRVQRALLALNDFFGFGPASSRSIGTTSPRSASHGAEREPYIDDSDLVDVVTGIFQARDRQGRSLLDPEIERELYEVAAGPLLGTVAAWGRRFFGGGLYSKFTKFSSKTPVQIERDELEQESAPTFYA